MLKIALNQIHGSDVRRVVAQKSVPSLTWRPGSLDHIFGDTRLRDCKPKLKQFQLDQEPAIAVREGSST